MLSTFDGYQQVVQRSHQALAAIHVYRSGVPYTFVPLADATVTMDRTASYRRSLSGTFVATDRVVPDGVLDQITPFGPEAVAYRGVRYRTSNAGLPRVVDAWYELGHFGISEVEVADDGSRKLSFTAYDRSRRVSRYRFTEPYVIAAGTNYATAIGGIMTDRYPDIHMSLMVTAEQTPLIVIDAGADPWAEVQNMASAIGAECYFDNTGKFILRRIPDPTTDPITWIYTEGQMVLGVPTQVRPTLLSVNRRYFDDPGYNGVVMTAESTTLPAPLRSIAWDNDPNSGTYYMGPYGKVPAFVSSPYIASQAGCDAAAKAELQRLMGGTEGISLTAIPNPAQEVGDTIQVNRAGAGIKSENMLIETLEMPLRVDGVMSITCRERRAA